jgi:hypothetical protein
MRISSPVCIGLALVVGLSPASVAGQTEEANRVFAQTSPGTLAIIALDATEKEIGRGTAFALAEDLLVTAYHLVSKAASVKAVNVKGKEMRIDGIIAVDKASDVAILKLRGKAQTLALGAIDSMKEGNRIFAVGANDVPHHRHHLLRGAAHGLRQPGRGDDPCLGPGFTGRPPGQRLHERLPERGPDGQADRFRGLAEGRLLRDS